MVTLRPYLNLIWLGLWMIVCMFAPMLDYTFKGELYVHNFAKDGTLVWFARDACYVLGLIVLPCIGFIKDAKMRRDMAIIFLLDGVRESWDLIRWNNLYDIQSLYLQNGFIILSIIYLVYRWKKSYRK